MSEQPVRSESRTQAPYSSLWLPLLVALGFAATGCGNFVYALQVNSASAKLEEARSLGAEQYAPYEYYMSQQHLEKAQSEASEADYGDAIELSGVAEEYADKAITLAREAHRGAGR